MQAMMEPEQMLERARPRRPRRTAADAALKPGILDGLESYAAAPRSGR
jgi:hypothetical protein